VIPVVLGQVMEDITVEKINNKFGFTLVELLVTISIIAVLTSIGVVFYQNSKQKADDAKRRQDLLNIQEAFEQYYAAEGSYPASCPSVGSSLTTTGGDALLDMMPDDPNDSQNYGTNCDSSYYCFSALLNDTDGGNCTGCSCSGDSCSFTTAADNTHFCVKHKQ